MRFFINISDELITSPEIPPRVLLSANITPTTTITELRNMFYTKLPLLKDSVDFYIKAFNEMFLLLNSDCVLDAINEGELIYCCKAKKRKIEEDAVVSQKKRKIEVEESDSSESESETETSSEEDTSSDDESSSNDSVSEDEKEVKKNNKEKVEEKKSVLLDRIKQELLEEGEDEYFINLFMRAQKEVEKAMSKKQEPVKEIEAVKEVKEEVKEEEENDSGPEEVKTEKLVFQIPAANKNQNQMVKDPNRPIENKDTLKNVIIKNIDSEPCFNDDPFGARDLQFDTAPSQSEYSTHANNQIYEWEAVKKHHDQIWGYSEESGDYDIIRPPISLAHGHKKKRNNRIKRLYMKFEENQENENVDLNMKECLEYLFPDKE